MRMKRFCVGTDATLLVALLAALGFTDSAFAQPLTLNQALGLAYENNPQLNAQRAALRAIDEDVAKALGGWRPTVTMARRCSTFWNPIRAMNSSKPASRNSTASSRAHTALWPRADRDSPRSSPPRQNQNCCRSTSPERGQKSQDRRWNA